MMIEAFHFLRPWWLLALIPATAVVAAVWAGRAASGGRDWAGLVDAHLLRHLALPGTAQGAPRAMAAALALGLAATVLALAGPAWEKRPVPTYQGGAPVVVALSLAPSMNGSDLAPSRLTRAGHKLRDILDRQAGADTGLVIYSDIAFTAAPLTTDAEVIRTMLPELSTGLMPTLGDRPDLAIAMAAGLLREAGAQAGRILLIADDAGSDPAATEAAARAARGQGYAVSVLASGTEAGAVLQTEDGRPIPGPDGAPQTVRLDPAALGRIAASGRGAMATITPGDADLDRVLPEGTDGAARASEMRSDEWVDHGWWLLVVPVLLAPLAFRRGVLFALMLALLATGPRGAEAADWAARWAGLWATPDQRGAAAFAAGDYGAAAQAFRDPGWKAGAAYRAGDYGAAAKDFPDAYNRGNALARSGDLEGAVKAYDAALATDPQDADARANRDLVQKLLDQQKQQQQGGQSGDKGQTANRSQKDGQKQDGQKGDDQKGGGQKQAGGQQAAGDPSQGGQSGGSQQAPDQQQSSGQGEKTQAAAPRPGDGDSAAQAGTGTPGDASKNQDQQQAPAGGDKPQDARQTGGGASGTTAEDRKAASGAMGQLLDKLLAGNGTASPPPGSSGPVRAPALDQSSEEMLRAVPDDPTGLLRARIRQHYAEIERAGQ